MKKIEELTRIVMSKHYVSRWVIDIVDASFLSIICIITSVINARNKAGWGNWKKPILWDMKHHCATLGG